MGIEKIHQVYDENGIPIKYDRGTYFCLNHQCNSCQKLFQPGHLKPCSKCGSKLFATH